MLDWVITGAEIIDGSGRPGYRADVGISEGRIAEIGSIEPGQWPHQARVIDGAGMVLSPGFIDVHSHSDLTLPVFPLAESSVAQGITTEVAGSCGWSLAPLKAETARGVLRRLLSGLCGISAKDIEFSWHSFAEYAAHVAAMGTSTNLYPVLGQSLLRAHVVGTDKRPATPEEIAAMRALLRQATADGCRGLSTGRGYLPGGHADTDEVAALCQELAPYGGIYTSHIKSESEGMLDAVDEVIAIGRRAGIKVQVSHHKAIGPQYFGLVRQSLERMEQARTEGVDIHCDVYPYDFAQVYMLRDGLVGHWRGLRQETVLKRLADPKTRDTLRRRLTRPGAGGLGTKPDSYLLIVVPGQPQLQGLSIKDAAEQAGKDPVDLCCDLLIHNELDVRIAARMCEDDVRTVLSHSHTMVGTDAFAVNSSMPPSVPLHPRHYGSFPRVAGHYRRDVGLFSLPEAVRKMTGLPAAKLGLSDRGIVAQGNWADLVLFDPDTIIDRATGTEPTLPPDGIRAVWINGELVASEGRHTGARPGQVLLGSR